MLNDSIEIDVNELSRCLIPIICPSCTRLSYPPSGSETCLDCWVSHHICEDCRISKCGMFADTLAMHAILTVVQTLAIPFPPYEQLCTEDCIICYMAKA